MIRSHNEIVAMALKAARGAGVPFGLAEDFARAVGVLALSAPQDLACVGTALGSSFADLSISGGEALVIAPAPVIMAAPMAIDALRSGTVKVVLQDVDALPLLRSYLSVVQEDFDLTLTLGADGETITAGGDAWPLYAPQPVEVDADVWAAWNMLAARTYVPATEASRLAGAGAGLTDND